MWSDLHHGCLGQRPIRVLDYSDGTQVVHHPPLALEMIAVVCGLIAKGLGFSYVSLIAFK